MAPCAATTGRDVRRRHFRAPPPRVSDSIRHCAGARSAGTPRQRLVMGDENEGRALGAIERENQIDDFAADGLVEIAGRLICDENGRIGDQGPRQGDALLLAARHLRGIMAHSPP